MAAQDNIAFEFSLEKHDRKNVNLGSEVYVISQCIFGSPKMLEKGGDRTMTNIINMVPTCAELEF